MERSKRHQSAELDKVHDEHNRHYGGNADEQHVNQLGGALLRGVRGLLPHTRNVGA